MFYSIALSKDFSGKTLKRVWDRKLHYERLSTYRVLIENNIVIENKLWNNTIAKDRL